MKNPQPPAWVDEYFWAGYLRFLAKQGWVTLETPREEVEEIKREFMAGLHNNLDPEGPEPDAA